ncbi:enah/Vasp-like a isoform X4 [Brachyhypopomus gauderio]|uniref:enah/Vasp-like a isoform X4 n=1 Tax=Brachyhypopomus gauderio TaxID=698409 RepID=UPI004042263A
MTHGLLWFQADATYKLIGRGLVATQATLVSPHWCVAWLKYPQSRPVSGRQPCVLPLLFWGEGTGDEGVRSSDLISACKEEKGWGLSVCTYLGPDCYRPGRPSRSNPARSYKTLHPELPRSSISQGTMIGPSFSPGTVRRVSSTVIRLTSPSGHRQNGPVSDEPDAQRRQMMDQHQMHVERERRTSGSSGPPLPPGHPSMLSSTPPLHPPAPMPAVGPPAPPPPPGPPPPTTAPLPIPPPLPAGGGPATSGLAAALAGAKLRKVPRPEESASGPGSAKSDASRSSGSSGGGGEGLMQEMNALLARRRKASEKPEDGQNEEANGSPGSRGSSQQNSTDAVKKPWERANSSDKPAGSRLRGVGTSSDAELADFDRMKQEILEEVVRELHKVKDEIIDAIRRELTRMGTT